MTVLALLANPESGSGEAAAAAELLRSRGAEVHAFGLDQADEAIALGPDRVVVAGGDGSIGRAAEVAARREVPLAVVPVGTANDFARAMGVPDDPEEACSVAVEGASMRPVDLGRMEDRPFVNVASAGLAPVAARKASGLKRTLGPLAYAVGAARAGLTAQPLRCRLRCDGRDVFAGRAWQVTVACSGAFGGGAEVEADPADGLLDAVAIEAGSRLALARRAHGLRAGRVESQRGVHSDRGRQIELEVPPGTTFNVDGEILTAGPRRFGVEPSAFRLLVP